ncbi:MAG TPA: sigma-54 dependent transcriptional regulator, partial [Kiritimatiellia bacterium]|nr:sigma-54 dependent transcriptional regulator [Kiritimatiellia bacterium]
MPKILIVDDEARILLLLQSLLKANGYDAVTAKDGSSALETVRNGDYDLVITDLRMSPMDGLTLFKEIKVLRPELPVILLTAYASVETAIEAMKNGAFDYLSKPFKVDEMLDTVKRAIESSRNAASAAVADPNAPLRYQFENLIATNSTMLQVCEMIQRVGPTAATVLINGESGTGKEVIARTIHNTSLRKDKPWVAVNCAALPENLLESEMFGHVKGAFTGAVADKEGLFETANGGTLFLDEIASLPLLLQGKLLRVLQEKEIRRVGGNKSIP